MRDMDYDELRHETGKTVLKTLGFFFVIVPLCIFGLVALLM